MHGYITAMPEHEFVLWVIGAHAEDRGKFVYELPGNVVEVHEVFQTMPCGFRASSKKSTSMTASARRCAVWFRSPIRTGTCCSTFSSAATCIRSHFAEPHVYGHLPRRVPGRVPYTPFADAFHTMRSMLLPVLYLLGSEVGCRRVSRHFDRLRRSARLLGSSVHHAPVLLTEHGIYTREREEEIIRADWVVPSFKDRWIRFFYLLFGGDLPSRLPRDQFVP